MFFPKKKCEIVTGRGGKGSDAHLEQVCALEIKNVSPPPTPTLFISLSLFYFLIPQNNLWNIVVDPIRNWIRGGKRWGDVSISAERETLRPGGWRGSLSGRSVSLRIKIAAMKIFEIS